MKPVVDLFNVGWLVNVSLTHYYRWQESRLLTDQGLKRQAEIFGLVSLRVIALTYHALTDTGR
jgi:hypothetical protein